MSRTETTSTEVVYDENRLEAADVVVTDLLGSLAHELRNPLASLQGCAQTLVERGDELPPEIRGRMAAVIAKNAERMDWLIRAVASFGDEGVPGEDPLDLAELLRATGASCRVAVEADGPVRIRGSEQRLQLALEAVLLAVGSGASARLDPGSRAVEIVAPAVDACSSGRRWKLQAASRMLAVDGASLHVDPERDRRTTVRIVFLPEVSS